MSREWTPGDVAIRTYLGSTPQRSLYVSKCGTKGHSEGPHWHHQTGGWDPRDGSATYRPLVVLDLKIGEAESFAAWLREHGHPLPQPVARICAQIEAQTRPPKPTEPTGLGAVVEDAEGDRWVRADKGVRVWTNGRYGTTTTWDVGNPYAEVYLCKWDEIDAVRVLSEGVQP